MPPGHPLATIDYDLHGRVGVRLLDAAPPDARIVERQLGPLRAPFDRDPDLVIRFVDRLEPDGNVRFLGHHDVGFTDTAYLVLRGRHKSNVRVALPMDLVGGPCEIVAERGIPAVPLLIPILNLLALGKGLVPLHASAFLHDGQGVLVLGWAKGGKSEALLAFTARGARYVGDEWVYVDPERRWLHGLPEPMRVWAWQLRSIPDLAGRVPRSDRRRLAATGALAALLGATARLPVVGRRSPGRLAHRAQVTVERQLSTQVPPELLMGGRIAGDGAPFGRIVLIMSHEDASIEIEPVEAADVARRATESFMFENSDLLAHHRRFRFAFANRDNPHLASLEERHRAAADAALRGVPAMLVRHPYPLEIPRLYDAIAPRLR